MLNVKDLSFSYDRKKSGLQVFKNLSAEFEPGLNAILGPNGAGKSTLLKSIFGLLKYEGAIFCGGENLAGMKTNDKTKLMSYLPQMDTDNSMLTVLEMILLGRLPELKSRVADEDLKIVMETMEVLNISSLASRSVGELSGGQRKLVYIAQTLVREPKVILMDEPLNSLDLQRQLELCELLLRIVAEKGISVIVVLHDINLAARFAERVVILGPDGSFYSAGKPAEVITEKMLREVYGVVASVNIDGNGIPTVSPVSSLRNIGQC